MSWPGALVLITFALVGGFIMSLPLLPDLIRAWRGESETDDEDEA